MRFANLIKASSLSFILRPHQLNVRWMCTSLSLSSSSHLLYIIRINPGTCLANLRMLSALIRPGWGQVAFTKSSTSVRSCWSKNCPIPPQLLYSRFWPTDPQGIHFDGGTQPKLPQLSRLLPKILRLWSRKCWDFDGGEIPTDPAPMSMETWLTGRLHKKWKSMGGHLCLISFRRRIYWKTFHKKVCICILAYLFMSWINFYITDTIPLQSWSLVLPWTNSSPGWCWTNWLLIYQSLKVIQMSICRKSGVGLICLSNFKWNHSKTCQLFLNPLVRWMPTQLAQLFPETKKTSETEPLSRPKSIIWEKD